MTMTPSNPLVRAVAPPPIADVQTWVRGREYPPERPLLDVAQAVPSYPPARSLAEHVAAEALNAGSAFYTPILGLPALREALAAHLGEDYDSHIPAGRIGITPGCNQAFCVAASAVAGPGDEIVLPAPYYFNHRMWLDMQGIRAVPVAFNPAGGAVPDVESIRAAMGPATRAIALVTPNNPTGAQYPAGMLASVYELARERGVALILDETYKDFRAEPGPAHRLFEHDDWGDHLIHLYSFSKAYSLTGYRVGSVTCGEERLDEIQKILDCLSICAPHLSQSAALHALEHLASWRDERAGSMLARVGALREAFARNELRYELVSAGAYFAYVRHPFGDEPSDSVARRLAEDHGVLCVPGSMFGPGQEPYLRFAFANLEGDAMPGLVERLVESQPGGAIG